MVYMIYMTSLVDIFVPSIYLTITREIFIAVGCVLASLCNYVGFIYPCNMLVV